VVTAILVEGDHPLPRNFTKITKPVNGKFNSLKFLKIHHNRFCNPHISALSEEQVCSVQK
jgi:hypothetical protein